MTEQDAGLAPVMLVVAAPPEGLDWLPRRGREAVQDGPGLVALVGHHLRHIHQDLHQRRAHLPQSSSGLSCRRSWPAGVVRQQGSQAASSCKTDTPGRTAEGAHLAQVGLLPLSAVAHALPYAPQHEFGGGLLVPLPQRLQPRLRAALHALPPVQCGSLAAHNQVFRATYAVRPCAAQPITHAAQRRRGECRALQTGT